MFVKQACISVESALQLLTADVRVDTWAQPIPNTIEVWWKLHTGDRYRTRIDLPAYVDRLLDRADRLNLEASIHEAWAKKLRADAKTISRTEDPTCSPG